MMCSINILTDVDSDIDIGPLLLTINLGDFVDSDACVCACVCVCIKW